MAGLAERAHERLAGVPAYQPGRPSPGPVAGKLSSNEAPLGPAPNVRAAIIASVGSINRYPEQGRVAELLAAYLAVPVDRLVLTNGSDELCYLVATLLLGPDRVAVAGEPCYQIDATATALAGATLRRVPLRRGGHDLDAMVGACAGASVVWVPSPHNPTGVTCDPSELEKFISEVPEDCLVVLDEAYRAFSDPGTQPDVERLLGTYPNLLVQRTLSKDWALAGLRIGYALASAPLAGALNKARAPFSVSSVALTAIEAAVGDDSWRVMSVARVREERARLESALARCGIEYLPSQANFVTARLDLEALGPALRSSGIVVRSGSDLGMPGWARISIGWAPQMAVLRSILYRSLTDDPPTDPTRMEA